MPQTSKRQITATATFALAVTIAACSSASVTGIPSCVLCVSLTGLGPPPLETLHLASQLRQLLARHRREGSGLHPLHRIGLNAGANDRLFLSP